jgi:hypothetical protein
LPRTPGRSRTNITQASLERLGVARLAGVLVDHARHDRDLRESLTRALAEAASGDDYAAYVERRLRAIAKAPMVDDAKRAKARLRELDELRRGVLDKIAPRDRAAATDLFRLMVEVAPTIATNIVSVFEQVEAWQTAVLADLARLWQEAGPGSLDAAVDFVAACCARYGAKPEALVAVFVPALGDDGLLRLRDRLQAELAALPAEVPGGRWGVAGADRYESSTRAWQLRLRLGEIADLRGDVDGYIALERAQPRNQVDVRAIAQRLIKAGRGAEALAWLDDARYQNRLINTADLRLLALESTGRADEAQALRWQRFERRLSLQALRDYLKRLPDFEDFEAERRAMAHVLAHKSVTEALAFLLAWPNLDGAAQLLETRWREFGPTPSESLLAAAEALRGRHPRAAVLATRLAVLSVMQRGLARLFTSAAEALALCATLAPPPSPNDETHAAFVDRLRETYPRQWLFWRAYDALPH